MIIDCHCHAGKGDGLGPRDTAAPLKKYLPRASKAGITHTNLFAAFHFGYAIANREVADRCLSAGSFLEIRIFASGARSGTGRGSHELAQ
jgi:hypothetical protein